MLVKLASRFLSYSIAWRLVHVAKRRAPEFRFSTDGDLVVLPNGPDTELAGNPGRYSIRFYEHKRGKVAGHFIAGRVVESTHRIVKRAIEPPLVGSLSDTSNGLFEGWLSGWLGTEPEHFAGDIERVTLQSGDWRLPSWQQLAPQPSSDWIIHVHGRTATPAETARNFGFFKDAGFNNLSISFRGDSEAFTSKSKSAKALGLGTTEWPDIEAAVQHALGRGAKRIVLFGWSYGGAICLEFSRNSMLASMVSGYIFDSPVISWRSTLKMQLRLNRASESLSDGVERYLADARKARRLGLPKAINLSMFEASQQAKHIDKPTLILHSHDDGYIPIDSCIELAKCVPEHVTLVEFKTARHCKLYNFDKTAYEKAITSFLDERI